MAHASGLVRQPVYQQLYSMLRELAASERYAGGEQFLTERQIVERFGISRATANKALTALVSEGCLEFRKGVGTFVREQKLDYDIASLVSFTVKAQRAGKAPTTRVLAFSLMSAENLDRQISEALHVSAGECVYAITRVRIADRLPVILERRWVPERLCPGLTRADLKGSIYSLWVNKYGLPITDADQVIQAVNLLGDDAKALATAEGAAGFLVSATGFSRGIPLWFERTLYRGDAYEFHHHRPAAGRLRSMPAKAARNK